VAEKKDLFGQKRKTPPPKMQKWRKIPLFSPFPGE
jgi:hypothetical protein